MSLFYVDKLKEFSGFCSVTQLTRIDRVTEQTLPETPGSKQWGGLRASESGRQPPRGPRCAPTHAPSTRAPSLTFVTAQVSSKPHLRPFLVSLRSSHLRLLVSGLSPSRARFNGWKAWRRLRGRVRCAFHSPGIDAPPCPPAMHLLYACHLFPSTCPDAHRLPVARARCVAGGVLLRARTTCFHRPERAGQWGIVRGSRCCYLHGCPRFVPPCMCMPRNGACVLQSHVDVRNVPGSPRCADSDDVRMSAKFGVCVDRDRVKDRI